MEFKEFVRKPFTVEAIEITTQNISECAKHIGDLMKNEDGSYYIQVDQQRIPNVFRVVPGYWMTRMNGNIRCYSNKVFKEQFVEQDAIIKQWVRANVMAGTDPAA